MKKLLLALVALIFTQALYAQGASPKTDTGTLNGAGYIILLPDNWKGKLVMYAHGYEFMGLMPRQSKDSGFINTAQPFLERGFAVAASDFAVQGYAIPQGVDNTEQLRQHFIKKYGKPDTTFVTGQSMGGGVTLSTIENFGGYYNGALPLCAMSSHSYVQMRKEFDLYATFNGLFPGVVQPLAKLFDLSKPNPPLDISQIGPWTEAVTKAIIAKDSALGVAFAAQLSLKFKDLPMLLFFDENVLKDIAQKAQGNPFDNTNTVYNNFPPGWQVNQKAERIAATVSPNVLFNTYNRTGDINKPVVMLHTTYDELLPNPYGVVNFENMVHQKGNDKYFTVNYTTGEGHCMFTPQEIGTAFDALRAWAKTGVKAKAGALQ